MGDNLSRSGADEPSLTCGPRDTMPTHEEHILRILGEAIDPLFPSDVAEQLNRELGPGAAYTSLEIVARLKRMSDQVAQLPDGRWMLKRLML